MYQNSQLAYQAVTPLYPSASTNHYSPRDAIRCEWKRFRSQMLLQWKKLSVQDLDEAGPSYRSIARLIEQKYGVAANLVENYIRNFDYTMLHPTKQRGLQ